MTRKCAAAMSTYSPTAGRPAASLSCLHARLVPPMIVPASHRRTGRFARPFEPWIGW